MIALLRMIKMDIQLLRYRNSRINQQPKEKVSLSVARHYKNPTAKILTSLLERIKQDKTIIYRRKKDFDLAIQVSKD